MYNSICRPAKSDYDCESRTERTDFRSSAVNVPKVKSASRNHLSLTVFFTPDREVLRKPAEAGMIFARSALYLRDVYSRTTEICPFRTTHKTIIITFCRAANEVDDSVLVKYVIFEKFRSDPEKDRC